MPLTATTLMISSNESLVDDVRGVISSTDNCRLEVCRGTNEALPELERQDVSILLYHLAEADDGAAVPWLLREIAAVHRPIRVVVISDRDNPEQALSMLRQGVAEYLSRPLDLARLGYLVDMLTLRVRHVAQKSLARTSEFLGAETVGEHDPFLYGTPQLRRVVDQVRKLAPLDTTILIIGETGVGKTRLARVVHELSPRRAQPFLAAHCGALSASLIESELFGHVKGAFTGADHDRAGRFAEVGAGTLLLDDINSLPFSLQAKLLRVVDERVFEQVGSNNSIPMRARLIAVSNQSLKDEVAAGRFRADLYYRLSVAEFYLPPLRNQRAIIGALADKFIGQFAARAGRPPLRLSRKAQRYLETHDWPGNIRQLRNVIELGCALCIGNEIGLADISDSITPSIFPTEAPEASTPLPSHLDLARTRIEAEVQRIMKALEKHGNNRLQAALELGISRNGLYKKLHKYGLI